MTVRSLLRKAHERFPAKDAAIDCDILICYVLGIERSSLFMHKDDEITSEKELEFEKYFSWLASGEPVQYITGQAPFGELTFRVTPDVLIPRFDTEVLFEHASVFLSEIAGRGKKPSFLDMCTGSGCLAVSLKYSHPCSAAYASDVSSKALDVARSNAAKLTGADSVFFTEGDLFEPYEKNPDLAGMKFDLIVSNPPYIPTADIDLLDSKVKDNEPRLALDGGDDGFCIYRSIISSAPRHLASGGFLMLEAGIGQASLLSDMMKKSGYDNVSVFRDYNSVDRVVTGSFR